MRHSRSQGTALITGASRGIGAVYADRLAKRGYDLILVARNEPRLKELSAHLTQETGRLVTSLRVDLSDKGELAQVESILRDDQAITMLVNNAGTASVAPLLHADVETMDDMIVLNVTALTRLTYAAAPAFVQRGAGTIINIASVVGIAPEDPFRGCTPRHLAAVRQCRACAQIRDSCTHIGLEPIPGGHWQPVKEPRTQAMEVPI